MKEDEITIQTTVGARKLTVERRDGDLAVHKSYLGGGWSITHVPTGYLVCSVKTKALIETLLTQFKSFDWKFRSSRSPKAKALRPKVAQAMERLTGSATICQVD